MRTFMLFVVAAVGVLLPVFSTWTVLIPLFFPRIAIMIRPFWGNKMGDNAPVSVTVEQNSQESEDEE